MKGTISTLPIALFALLSFACSDDPEQPVAEEVDVSYDTVGLDGDEQITEDTELADGDEPDPNTLDGDWMSPCIDGLMITLSFAEGTLTKTETFSADDGCAEPDRTVTTTGTYVTAEGDGSDEANDIDTTIDRVELTLHTDDAAQTARRDRERCHYRGVGLAEDSWLTERSESRCW